ncbi:MAG: hypothetical protein CSA47_02145 [Gammaproteobacteria bacterium]|nr:MAG: hypothetical protein CSA47_02145 [Gammaproteobacteria bacterium]
MNKAVIFCSTHRTQVVSGRYRSAGICGQLKIISAAVLLALSGQAMADYAAGDAGGAAATPGGGSRKIAIGTNQTSDGVTTASGNMSIAIGGGAQAVDTQSIAIGTKGTQALGNQSIAIGGDTVASGADSIAIGGDDLDGVANDPADPIPYGVYNGATYGGSVVDNDRFNASQAAQDYRAMTGQYLVDNTDATTRYIKTEANGAGSVVLGVQSKAVGDLATAIGTGSKAEASGSTAFGIGSVASKENSVALGAGSKTSTDAAAVDGATIGTGADAVAYSGFAGDENVVAGDQVSVGSAGYERQIKHVAPGAITATSTDAINGSQLYVVANGLQNQIRSSSWKIAGNDKAPVGDGVNPDEQVNFINGSGTIVTVEQDGASNDFNVKYDVNVDNTTIEIDAGTGQVKAKTSGITTSTAGVATATTPAALATAGDIADAINRSGFTLTAQGLNDSLVSPGGTVDMNNSDGNIVITKGASNNDVTYNLANSINVTNVTATNSIAIAGGPSMTTTGINAGGNTITNVAPGVNGTDAVNVNQLRGATQNLYQAIDDVADDANAGSASAIAAANLPQPHDPGASMVSAGLGYYEGQTGLAVGLSTISDNGRWVIKGSLTTNTEKHFGAGVGVGYQW